MEEKNKIKLHFDEVIGPDERKLSYQELSFYHSPRKCTIDNCKNKLTYKMNGTNAICWNCLLKLAQKVGDFDDVKTIQKIMQERGF